MALQTIDRIGPMSAAKIMGVLYALIGLFIGGLVTLVSVMGAALGGAATKDLGGFGIIGMAAIVIAPICYGILGFIGGLIAAALYNLVAKFSGGIEIELS
ncbi:MAG: hypothetical protein ABIR28_11905 [Vicinamibacteria bacterium]